MVGSMRGTTGQRLGFAGKVRGDGSAVADGSDTDGSDTDGPGVGVALTPGAGVGSGWGCGPLVATATAPRHEATAAPLNASTAAMAITATIHGAGRLMVLPPPCGADQLRNGGVAEGGLRQHLLQQRARVRPANLGHDDVQARIRDSHAPDRSEARGCDDVAPSGRRAVGRDAGTVNGR